MTTGLKDSMKKYSGDFSNVLCHFIYLRSYASYTADYSRKETWSETVSRYMNFMREYLGNKLTQQEYDDIYQAIYNQQLVPSMRIMQFAGEAVKHNNVASYNCSYIAPNCLKDLSEIMYVSMCGTGVGFSVEKENIDKLPTVAHQQLASMIETFVIEDSREGWCDALYAGLNCWYSGHDIKFDYSKLRPIGAPLHTLSGHSAGPEPLKNLLNACRKIILKNQGQKLSTLEVHDLICEIGSIVSSGGVRHSAMLSLSDVDDAAMRNAKRGQFYHEQPQRSFANNSAVYKEKPTQHVFLREWLALMESGSGERGLFVRSNILNTMPQRRLDHLKNKGVIQNDKVTGFIGVNPCGEIILQSKQFCNLSEVVARPEDDLKSLKEKIRLAAIIGTFQAMLTDFPYLSEDWKKNCEDEALLGVSITGQWDCETVRNGAVLTELKQHAIEINQTYAQRFGINPATSVTCVKPSGTVSQVMDCAAGIHPRYSKFYIRRVRIHATNPLFLSLKKQGVPYKPEVGQNIENASTYVFEFPVKSPDGALTRDDLTAIDQLNYWRLVKTHYTEHNPSVTIYVDDNEWIDVAKWLYDNWEIIGGLAFLPKSTSVYKLMPFEAIDEETYNAMLKNFEGVTLP